MERPALKLVVSNEDVALTDKEVLEHAEGCLTEVLQHIEKNGLEHTGEEWILGQLRIAESCLDDVLTKLNSMKKRLENIS